MAKNAPIQQSTYFPKRRMLRNENVRSNLFNTCSMAGQSLVKRCCRPTSSWCPSLVDVDYFCSVSSLVSLLLWP
jgi:hypothetical protein